MNPYLPYASDFAVVVSMILGLIALRRLSVTGKLILLQMIIAVSTEASALWVLHVHHQPNLWIYNGYILLEFQVLLAAGIYLNPTKRAKLVAMVCAPVFFLIWLGNMLLLKPDMLVTFSFVTGYTGLSAYYLWQQISLLKTETQYYPNMLLGLGVIIYSTCCIPLYGLHNYFIGSDAELNSILYASGNILNIFRYTIIGISYLICLRGAQNYKVQ